MTHKVFTIIIEVLLLSLLYRTYIIEFAFALKSKNKSLVIGRALLMAYAVIILIGWHLLFPIQGERQREVEPQPILCEESI